MLDKAKRVKEAGCLGGAHVEKKDTQTFLLT